MTGVTADPESSVIGPVQILVVGFEEPHFTGKILPELKRLRERDVVRVLDLLVVQKDEKGEVDVYKQTDLEHDEAVEFGALVGALIGLGTLTEEGVEAGAAAGAAALEDDHVIDDATAWYVTDTIPDGTAAAIVLIEHRWAIPLRSLIVDAGGFPLADAWVHPADLVALGMVASMAAATPA